MKHPVTEYSRNRPSSQRISPANLTERSDQKFNSYTSETSCRGYGFCWFGFFSPQKKLVLFLKSLLPYGSDINNLPFDGVTGPYEENLQTERAQRK